MTGAVVAVGWALTVLPGMENAETGTMPSAVSRFAAMVPPGFTIWIICTMLFSVKASIR